MVKKAELSVVIPVYNGEAFIRETVESVLHNSKDFNVECIVINDGSNDNTSEILESFGGRIVLFSQPNSGESAAVNKGLKNAVGDLVVVVSADDPIISPDFFKGVTDFFNSNPSVVAWYPDWNIIDIQGNVLKTIRLKEYSFKDLFGRNKVLPGPGTWFRVKVAREIGGRNLEWKYVGDYDFWLRLSLKGRLVHRDKVLGQWRRHEGSTSISQRGARMADERIRVIDSFINANPGTFEPELEALARANAHFLAAKLGYFSIEVNSRDLLLRAFKLNPRFILEAKPQEIVFMILFPFSKRILNFFLREN